MSLGIYGLLLAAALAGANAAAEAEEANDDLPLLSKIAYHYDDYIHSLDRATVISLVIDQSMHRPRPDYSAVDLAEPVSSKISNNRQSSKLP